MPAFTTAMIVGGLALNAYGQWKAGSNAKKAGQAQQRAANAQAELLDFNAHVADLQAQDALDRGVQEEARFRSGVKLMIGAQRTGAAAGNIDVNTGSAVDVQADAAYLGELDALQIRQNAAREAWGYKVESYDTTTRAGIARKEGVMLEATGRANQSAARVGAVGGVLAGAGSILEARYGFKETKTKTGN